VKPGESPKYDFSEVYTLLARSNHLYEVLQILKGIAQGMIYSFNWIGITRDGMGIIDCLSLQK
jgi:hypothetical protein